MAKMLKISTDKAATSDAAKAEATVKKAKAKAEVADTPEPKAKKAKAPKEEKPSRFVGVTSGMRVTVFQNHSLEQNAKKKLSDEALAKVWRTEFPNAIAKYSAETVNGVRNLYNLGKHGNALPSVPLLQYDDAGKAIAARAKGERAVPAKKAKAEPVAEAPAPKLRKIKKSA